MKQKITDIAIIGGGLASLAAACELASSGLEITLVSKAPGALALSSGAWDLCNDPLSYSIQDFQNLKSTAENIVQMATHFPHHPFNYLQKALLEKNVFEFLQEKMTRLTSALPLPMVGNGLDLQVHLTEYGTLKVCGLVGQSQAAGNFLAMQEAKILIVGIAGLPNFRARFLKNALEDLVHVGRLLQVEMVGYYELELPGNYPSANLNPVEVALALERPEILKDVTQKISAYLENKVYTHLLLPPVLGLTQTERILTELQDQTGLQAAEVVATPTSVPGYRLQQAAHAFFEKKNYELWQAEVIGFKEKANRLESLLVHSTGEPIDLKAKAFILATGKFLGGGIRSVQTPKVADPLSRLIFEEPIFHLPLFVDGKPLNHFSMRHLATENIFNPQLAFCVGIKTNERLQPIDLAGQACFENLYAAGQILSGFDPTREGCSAGVSIISGSLAGQQASKSVL